MEGIRCKARELVASQALNVNEITVQEVFKEINDMLETGKRIRDQMKHFPEGIVPV